MSLPIVISQSSGVGMSNAALLVVCTIGCVLLVRYLIKTGAEFGDVFRIVARSVSFSKRTGGPHDLAFAFLLVLAGFAIRSETVWELRAFDSPIRLWQLILGTVLAISGILVIVKTLSPEKMWRLYFCLSVSGSLAFAALTYWWTVD